MFHLNLLFLIKFIFLEKKTTKIILNFNHLSDIDRIIQDFDLSSFEIKNISLKYRLEDLEKIPLNSKTLCILLDNLKLLEKNEKIKEITVNDIAITKENKDVWGKLEFGNDGVDKTGYFKGKFTDQFEIRKDLFFHPKNIEQKVINTNIKNIFKIISYIAILKNKSLSQLYQEKCNLCTIDLIIFNNFYVWKEEKELKMCICKDLTYSECDEDFMITKTKLLEIR